MKRRIWATNRNAIQNDPGASAVQAHLIHRADRVIRNKTAQRLSLALHIKGRGGTDSPEEKPSNKRFCR